MVVIDGLDECEFLRVAAKVLGRDITTSTPWQVGSESVKVDQLQPFPSKFGDATYLAGSTRH